MSDQLSRYPILLYSPGYGNPVFTGTFQTEFLASHGYVVFSIGHTGFDSRQRFPDGHVYQSAEEETEAQPEPPEGLSPVESPIELYRRAGKEDGIQSVYSTGLRDVTFVLDQLEAINSRAGGRFSQRLDLSKVGGLGFSIGGSIYFQATVEEPRIAAAANMDGGLNGLSVLAEGARKPILLVQASDNYPRVSNGPADAAMEEFFVEVERETWQMLRLSNDEWYKATILGTEHPHFSDAYLIAPAPEGMIDPQRGHYLMNRLALEFFDRHLRGIDTAPLLEHEETFNDLRLISKLARSSQAASQ